MEDLEEGWKLTWTTCGCYGLGERSVGRSWSVAFDLRERRSEWKAMAKARRQRKLVAEFEFFWKLLRGERNGSSRKLLRGFEV